jgi:hypothetical protein
MAASPRRGGPSLTITEFPTPWRMAHAPLVAVLPSLRRSVQNHAMLEAMEADARMLYAEPVGLGLARERIQKDRAGSESA